MEEHVYSILAIDGIIEKQQPEPPPKYIQKHRQQHRTHRKRQDPGCLALRTGLSWCYNMELRAFNSVKQLLSVLV